MRSSSASQLISVLCKSNHIMRRICSFTMFHHYETMDEAVDEVHNLSDIAIPKVLVLQMVLWTFGWNWAVYQLAQHGSLVPFTPFTPTNPSPHPSPHGTHTPLFATRNIVHENTSTNFLIIHQHHHISTIHSTCLGSDHGHGVGGRTVCKYVPYCMELNISVICHKHCCMISRGYSHMDMFQ